MKTIFTFLFAILTIQISAQEEGTGREFGLDGYVNASTLGGTFGAGFKYGISKQPNLVYGPSIRIQRFWSNYAGQKTGFLIYGGGAFLHYRYKNLLFAGTEFEVLRTPSFYNYGQVSPTSIWVPTFFVGGGFSKRWDSGFRLNAGMFYDVINNLNSPFRLSYISKYENGKLIPLIYRIGCFFDI